MIRNMKIGAKLILFFVLVVLVTSIAGITGFVLLQTVDTDYSRALVYDGFSQGYIGNLNTYLNKGAAVVRDIVMQTDLDDIRASQVELEDITQKTSEALEQVRLYIYAPEGMAYISTIDTKLPEYRTLRDQVIALGLQNRNEEAMEIFYAQARPILNEIMQAAQDLGTTKMQQGAITSDGLTAQSRVAMIVIMGIIIASFVVSIIIATVVSRSISRPIIAVEKAAGQLAQGDLSIKLTSTSNDEVGMMTRSFSEATGLLHQYIADLSRCLGEMSNGNFDVTTEAEFRGEFVQLGEAVATISDSLSQTLGQINVASEQVASGSDQVSSGAQALSQGATEQASSVEELAATINEISQNVKNNAANAISANGLVTKTGQDVSVCNEQMTQMVDSMQRISTSSSEIGKIIKTIEDIAFQTNILALNAAVEAARAGAAGKGFAVVADEVRNLASKSSEAAKNTTALIEGSLASVKEGASIVAATQASLSGVVQGAEQIAQSVEKITASSNEQADAIAQVTQGIDQISAVVQTNSATSEESAAASEELSSQAQLLKELVSRFNLKGAASRPASMSSAASAPVDRSSHMSNSMGGKY